jgi:hypothetical protein
MRGLDPRIHRKSLLFVKAMGLHRTSGPPEVRTYKCRKSGKPDLRVKPGNDGRELASASALAKTGVCAEMQHLEGFANGAIVEATTSH